MIYDNMILPENTLPLDNIISAQNNRMMSQNATMLQDMLAQQNRVTDAQNIQQNNMMPTRNMNAMSNMQAADLQLAQSCFAVHEAVLYLDTHPNDQNALEYYRRKQQQLNQATENYQKVVGPMRACMVDTNTGGWRWVETPWPWELEEV